MALHRACGLPSWLCDISHTVSAYFCKHLFVLRTLIYVLNTYGINCAPALLIKTNSTPLARPLHIDSSGPLCPQFTLLLLCSCVTTGVALSNPFSPHASLTTARMSYFGPCHQP